MRCLPSAIAILSFVPTPSILDTRTGSFIPLKSALNSPPNPPIRPRTSGPNVVRTLSCNPFLTRLPRSMSTPAAAYAFRFSTFLISTRQKARDAVAASLNDRERALRRSMINLSSSRSIGTGYSAIETSQTEFVHWQPSRPDHSFDIQISDRIDSQIFAISSALN